LKLKVSIKIIEIKVDKIKIKIDEFNKIIPLDKIGSFNK